MNLSARKGFRSLIRVLDAINPVLVALSVVGLFLEYTAIAPYVGLANNVVSMFFIFDFLVRLAAFPAADYFFRSFGWVDFLAGLPGLFVFIEGSSLFSVFKVVRIGRFFRIIRVLRFLRAFDFIKKMRGDSAWIQERIMQIGVSVVLIFVSGLILMDLFIFSDPAFAVGEAAYRGIMISLLATLLAILVVLIFYMGSVFAKDMRILQLIIDSADAEDYLLLVAEAEPLKDEFGGLSLEDGELETVSLLKMAAKMASALGAEDSGPSDPSSFALFGSGEADEPFPASTRASDRNIEDLAHRIEHLEDLLRQSNEKIVMETLRRAAPAIRNYLKGK